MTNDTLKALVIFATFLNSNWDPVNDNSSIIYMQHWPGATYNQKPSWADSVICPTTTNIWHPSLTGQLRQSSNGKFWLIGDVYEDLVVTDHDYTYYTSANGKNIGYAVKEIIDKVTPNVNWSDYDRMDPCDADTDGKRNESDGQVDFIFLMLRFAHSSATDGYGYTGIAALGGLSGRFGDSVVITRQGKKISASWPGWDGSGSGCISEMPHRWSIGVPQHEFAFHYAFGGDRTNGLGSHNIQGGGLASALDREQLSWTFGNIYQPTSNSTNINIRDYATTGDYIKILRNGKTYYIENRRRLNFYSSSNMHKWRWTLNEPLMSLQADSGLYIYTSNNDEHCFHAYGKWDFSKCSPTKFRVLKPPYFFQFIPESVNRFSGLRVMDLSDSVLDVNCNTVYNTYINPQRPVYKAFYIGVQGDSNTCFDVDYNEVFSPWSNPGISIGSSSDSLVIELDERHSDGSIDVNVYFTDLLQAEPSKPQFIKTARQYLSSPPDAFKTRLTWLKNLESDISNYCIYKGVVEGNNLDATNYQWLGVTSDTFYVDNSVLYVHGGGSGVCDRDPVKNVYRVTAIDLSEKESVLSDRDSMSVYSDPCGAIEEDSLISNNITLENKLFQNYPNPYNPNTKINYSLKHDGQVSITLYDILGKKVAILVNEFKSPGKYYFNFNAADYNLSSGIYFYKIETHDFTQIRHMILLK